MFKPDLLDEHIAQQAKLSIRAINPFLAFKYSKKHPTRQNEHTSQFSKYNTYLVRFSEVSRLGLKQRSYTRSIDAEMAENDIKYKQLMPHYYPYLKNVELLQIADMTMTDPFPLFNKIKYLHKLKILSLEVVCLEEMRVKMDPYINNVRKLNKLEQLELIMHDPAHNDDIKKLLTPLIKLKKLKKLVLLLSPIVQGGDTIIDQLEQTIPQIQNLKCFSLELTDIRDITFNQNNFQRFCNVIGSNLSYLTGIQLELGNLIYIKPNQLTKLIDALGKFQDLTHLKFHTHKNWTKDMMASFNKNFSPIAHKFSNLDLIIDLKLDSTGSLKKQFSNTLAKMINLQEVSLQITDKKSIEEKYVLPFWDGFKACTKLKSLSITYSGTVAKVGQRFKAFVKSISNLKELRDVNISFSFDKTVFDDDVEALTDSLREMKKLEKLQLFLSHCSSLSDKSLKMVSGVLKNFENLEYFSFGINKVSTVSINGVERFLENLDCLPQKYFSQRHVSLSETQKRISELLKKAKDEKKYPNLQITFYSLEMFDV